MSAGEDPGWLARAWTRIRRAQEPAPPAPRAPDLLHWSALHDGMPYCGARHGLPWTIEPEAATCPDCRREAGPLVLQHRVNNR